MILKQYRSEISNTVKYNLILMINFFKDNSNTLFSLPSSYDLKENQQQLYA